MRLRHHADALVLRLPACWLAQMFAFTPIAFMIMRGVVQGMQPDAGGGGADAARRPLRRPSRTVTLPLLKPGLANAFLVGFIESIADFGNPIVVGGQFSRAVDRDLLRHRRRAVRPGPRRVAGAACCSLFALAVFFAAARRARHGPLHHRLAARATPACRCRCPRGVRAADHRHRAAVDRASRSWSTCSPSPAASSQTWGRDYTPTLAHFRTAFALEWGRASAWSGPARPGIRSSPRSSSPRIAAPLTAALGLLIAWLLARTALRGQRAFEFAALLAFAIPGTVLGVSYILAFNVPPFELTGTALIIVLCFVFRNLPVGVRAGTAAFKQIDRSLDEASLMLRAARRRRCAASCCRCSSRRWWRRWSTASCAPMTTVSAVIFLVTAENELATTYIIGRVGNGDYGVALAYCTVLILLMSRRSR